MFNLLNGYKTYIAGVGLILLGLGTILKAVADGDWSSLDTGFAMIANGLGFVGVKHAITKSGGNE